MGLFVCWSCTSEIIIPVKSSQLEVFFERRNNFLQDVFFFILKDYLKKKAGLI